MIRFPEREPYNRRIKNPWLLEPVRNGLKAISVKERNEYLEEDRKIPVHYFEDDRIFGQGAFDRALKVTDMFEELRSITPKTRGFIFGEYKYTYHGTGILRTHSNGTESYYSADTLRNQSVACYLNLVQSKEEEIIQSLINELDNVTTSRLNTQNTDRKRIPYSDSE